MGYIGCMYVGYGLCLLTYYLLKVLCNHIYQSPYQFSRH